MRKRLYGILACLLVCLLLSACGEKETAWAGMESVPAARQRQIQKEMEQAAALCRELYMAAEKLPPEYSGGAQRLTQTDIDAMERCLIEAGFAVLDSDEIYPEYLANPGGLQAFAEAGEKTASQSVLRVGTDGGLQHLFFCREEDGDYFVLTDVFWDEQKEAYVRECGMRPIYDMELADWGILYYQIYPEDPHYITYSQIRMEPADRTLYDLTRKYILPVGYQFTNLFLTDWQEGDWGELSFNDLLEYLYRMNTGEVLDEEQFVYQQETAWAIIPAALFEETVLPWFDISVEELRTLGGYQAEGDCYFWRPRLGDDVTAWKYPMCEPEVTGWSRNSDGTITLEVRVSSPDLKTDRLFTHAVTVRPLEGEKFQYVTNRVTSISDRGLPPSMPRFALDNGE